MIFPIAHPSKQLQESWSEFLAQWPWQWFCTFTFANPPHPEAANKTFNYFIKRVNREIYGCRAHKRGQSVHWARAAEPHKSGVMHYHALLGDVQNLNTLCSRNWAHSLWYEIAGINRIDPIDNELRAVTNYVCKYVVKGGEIDLSGNLSEFSEQLSGLAT